MMEGGAWVSPSVKRPTLGVSAQVMTSGSVSLSPAPGSVLAAWSLLGMFSLPLSLSLSLSLCASLLLVLSLCLSK